MTTAVFKLWIRRYLEYYWINCLAAVQYEAAQASSKKHWTSNKRPLGPPEASQHFCCTLVYPWFSVFFPTDTKSEITLCGRKTQVSKIRSCSNKICTDFAVVSVPSFVLLLVTQNVRKWTLLSKISNKPNSILFLWFCIWILLFIEFSVPTLLVSIAFSCLISVSKGINPALEVLLSWFIVHKCHEWQIPYFESKPFLNEVTHKRSYFQFRRVIFAE